MALSNRLTSATEANLSFFQLISCSTGVHMLYGTIDKQSRINLLLYRLQSGVIRYARPHTCPAKDGSEDLKS